MNEKTIIRRKSNRLKNLTICFFNEWFKNEPRKFVWQTKYGTYEIIYKNNQLESVTLVQSKFFE